MNNYGYLQGLLFFMIFGTNMSSSFINLYMNGFSTQWSFHIVQEHPNQSSDGIYLAFMVPTVKIYVDSSYNDS